MSENIRNFITVSKWTTQGCNAKPRNHSLSSVAFNFKEKIHPKMNIMNTVLLYLPSCFFQNNNFFLHQKNTILIIFVLTCPIGVISILTVNSLITAMQ